MEIKIQVRQPINRLAKDLLIQVQNFVTDLDFAQIGASASVCELIEHRFKLLSLGIQQCGSELFRQKEES